MEPMPLLPDQGAILELLIDKDLAVRGTGERVGFRGKRPGIGFQPPGEEPVETPVSIQGKFDLFEVNAVFADKARNLPDTSRARLHPAIQPAENRIIQQQVEEPRTKEAWNTR